jgi:hypothetical protein
MEFALAGSPPGVPIMSQRMSMIAAPKNRTGMKAIMAVTVNQTGFLVREGLIMDAMG